MEFDFRFIVLVLFVVISAIQWIMKRLNPPKEDLENLFQETFQEPSPSIENIYEKYREQIRKRQTTAHQTNSNDAPPPMPMDEVKPEPEPIQKSIETEVSPYETKQSLPSLSDEELAAASRMQNTRQKTSTKRKTTQGDSSLQELLTSPASARQAIILTEVLGKPKSLQKDPLGYS